MRSDICRKHLFCPTVRRVLTDTEMRWSAGVGVVSCGWGWSAGDCGGQLKAGGHLRVGVIAGVGVVSVGVGMVSGWGWWSAEDGVVI